jgi:hypothetical protein
MTDPQEETRRTVRVPEDEWRRAKAAVAMGGTTISDVVRDALREYVKHADLGR